MNKIEKISEFQIKDVINVSDGSKLGHIQDIEINLNTGKIEAIIVTNTSRMLGLFGKENEMVVSWSNILKIGEDVVLVRYNDSPSEEFFLEKKET